jgi:L-aminopeptidase/D-esterase-like protein
MLGMRRRAVAFLSSLLLVLFHAQAIEPTFVLRATVARQVASMKPASKGLTDVPGIKVGHFTMTERPTGCTVILAEAGAVAGVDVRGAAPATRETDLLNPVNTVQVAHAIVLSGGSVFGLDTASGVMRYLEEHKIGFAFGPAHVPIVPAAALFDLSVGDGRIRPNAECGYQAARSASADAVKEGNVGAGAGATVGKAGGAGRAMKGGIGTASLTMPDGTIVAAMVATNGLGDVVDPATGRIVAGVRTADGKAFADARALLRSGGIRFRAGENTTLGVIATNASLSKTEAKRVAEMAHDGYARAIVPSHTPVDGDTIFTLATGAKSGRADAGLVGALAADVTVQAILRAVQAATGLPGYPAARDMPSRSK